MNTFEERKNARIEMRQLIANPIKALQFLFQLKHNKKNNCRFLFFLKWKLSYYDYSLSPLLVSGSKSGYLNVRRCLKHLYHDGILDGNEYVLSETALYLIYKLINKYKPIYLFF